MLSNLKQARKEAKKKNKQIKAEEAKKTQERIKKVDKKANTIADKLYRFNVKLFGIGFVNWFEAGNIGRGLLWLMQDLIIAIVAIGSTMWMMTTFLPNVGNMIGHAAGLAANAPFVDFQNLMFNPMIYFDMAALILQIGMIKLVWQWLNKLFGRWRYKNALNHGVKDYPNK